MGKPSAERRRRRRSQAWAARHGQGDEAPGVSVGLPCDQLDDAMAALTVDYRQRSPRASNKPQALPGELAGRRLESSQEGREDGGQSDGSDSAASDAESEEAVYNCAQDCKHVFDDDVPLHIGKGGKRSQAALNPANAAKNAERDRQQAEARLRAEARLQAGPANMRQIHRDIKAFVAAGADGELVLDPQPPAVRAFVHTIARMYALSSRSRGKGVERACVVSADGKVAPRQRPVDVRLLDRTLDAAQRAANHAHADGLAAFKKKGPTRSGLRAATRGQKGSAQSGALSTRPAVGSTVGADAAPLGDDNVGNQMLRRLGWQPGSALGADSASDRILEPVAVVFRSKQRTGLGL